MIEQQAPDRLYEELFELVQSQHLFSDSKTFVDAVSKADPADILSAFRSEATASDFDLEAFVRDNFELPESDDHTPMPSDNIPVASQIERLWDVLTRGPDEKNQASSLIPLPRPYVVPGGRFREVYYWDSYFTMLGLAASGRIRAIEDMVENFAYLIDEIGFVPNGNRTYYCTRSQPPFFALMVELLADAKKDQAIFERYLPQMIKEYQYWMAGSDDLDSENSSHRRVIRVNGGYLNRYWDDADTPRQESYAEDVELAANTDRDAAALYRDIRAGAESGWDFSSRWFADGYSKETICTTQIVPVDLNALMYNLEATLERTCNAAGDKDGADMYGQRAASRKQLLQTLFFDTETGFFVDLTLPDLTPTGILSLAATYPLYFDIATPEQASQVARRVHEDFLRPGGWVTTLVDTGQQWDSPNGWAPMQYVTYRGLENYGYDDEAEAGARRWVDNNLNVYSKSGRLLEKYNVEDAGTAGIGGEYVVQDGFGWTNAVLLRFMARLGIQK